MPEFLPTILAQLDFFGSAIGVAVSIVVSFVLITLVASYFRFQHILELAEKEQPEEVGVLDSDILRVQLARYLTGCSRRGTSFTMALIRRANSNVPVHMSSPLADAISHAVRQDDTVCIFDEQTVVLLAESEPEDAEYILGRTVKEVAKACPDLSLEQMRVGMASYPGHGARGKELIEVAQKGLEQTVAERPIVLPEITIVDSEEDPDELPETDIHEADAGNFQEENAGDVHEADAGDDHPEDEEEKESSGWRGRRKDAVLDPVTGVLKPSVVSAYMQRLMSELRYKKKKVALFCVGVNNMEHIARFHGEQAADDILAGVSGILQGHLRATDLIGRHEKYAFLALVQCTLEEAELIGRRISTLVNLAEFKSENKKLKTTITLGVSVYPEHGRNLHHLYTAGQKVLDHSRANDIRAYAVYDPEIHDKVPSKPMKSIKSLKA
jgi:diguanylate cyclase (GGDEF)-like protein